jgi:hypothetical protein
MKRDGPCERWLVQCSLVSRLKCLLVAPKTSTWSSDDGCVRTPLSPQKPKISVQISGSVWLIPVEHVFFGWGRLDVVN